VFDVGFCSAWLIADYQGFEADLSSRYGLQAHPQSVKILHKQVQEVNEKDEKGATLGGGAVGPVVNATTSLTEKKEKGASRSVERSEEQTKFLVETHGDQTWRFTGQVGGPLEGNILPTVPLVRLSHAPANRKHIQASIMVKQRDLKYEIVEGIPFISAALGVLTTEANIKKKLAGIVLAKALGQHAARGSQYMGAVTVSEAVLSDGSDESV